MARRRSTQHATLQHDALQRSATLQIDEICIWNGTAPIKVFDDEPPSGAAKPRSVEV
jgi:hypothetical protein